MPRLPALSWIRSTISEGLGPTASYNSYRAEINRLNDENPDENWVGQRTQDFYGLYGDISNMRGQSLDAIQAPKDIPGGGLTPEPWRTEANIEGYGHWVGISQIDRETGARFQFPYLIRSDTILTPAEAEQRATDFLSTQPDNYNRRTTGVYFTGLSQFNPNPANYE